MAARKKKKFNSLLVLLFVLAVAGGVLILNNKSKKNIPGSEPAYPDNSALGVTYNFYQWYTSCIEESRENGDTGFLTSCYQKTTYLTPDTVKSLDKVEDSVLCGKTLDFHSVDVKKVSEESVKTLVNVSNSKTGEFVAQVTTNNINGQWQITGIACFLPD